MPHPHPPLTFDPSDPTTFFYVRRHLYGVGGKLYATFDAFAIDPYLDPPTVNHEYISPALSQINTRTGTAMFDALTQFLR